jgi:hypothetical protein
MGVKCPTCHAVVTEPACKGSYQRMAEPITGGYGERKEKKSKKKAILSSYNPPDQDENKAQNIMTPLQPHPATQVIDTNKRPRLQCQRIVRFC